MSHHTPPAATAAAQCSVWCAAWHVIGAILRAVVALSRMAAKRVQCCALHHAASAFTQRGIHFFCRIRLALDSRVVKSAFGAAAQVAQLQELLKSERKAHAAALGSEVHTSPQLFATVHTPLFDFEGVATRACNAPHAGIVCRHPEPPILQVMKAMDAAADAEAAVARLAGLEAKLSAAQVQLSELQARLDAETDAAALDARTDTPALDGQTNDPAVATPLTAATAAQPDSPPALPEGQAAEAIDDGERNPAANAGTGAAPVSISEALRHARLHLA